ncbi:MAG TPA: molybdopterin-dependent oxidoreductase [Anaerolineales bacterium]|nr:molybdopterin-dependent oxidoreductase [Anaerolineales bacterium]
MNGTNLRFINALILIVFCVLGLTGLYGLMWPFPPALFTLHRIAGWALIVLIPWKGAIALRSLGRGLSRRFDRNVMIVISILLSIATLTVLLLVLMWTWQIGPYYVWIGRIAYSGIGWHWGIALGLAPLFIIHVWQRWPRPRRTDFAGRRQALKLMGFGAAAVLSWGVAETLAKSLESTGAPRHFTGSREDGSFTGLSYPVTSGADQGKIRLNPSTWTLSLTGKVKKPLTLNYADVLTLSISEVTATIDCTGGWYSTQIWRGIRLSDLLAQAETQKKEFYIVLKGVSGYIAYFTSAEASEILLATHVGGQVLDHWHGYPLRAVVPPRRGWQWVKWITEVEVH